MRQIKRPPSSLGSFCQFAPRESAHQKQPRFAARIKTSLRPMASIGPNANPEVIVKRELIFPATKRRLKLGGHSAPPNNHPPTGL